MINKKYLVIMLGILLLLPFFIYADDLVMFNYEGFIKIKGKPFNGTGYFKFALITLKGDNPSSEPISLWSNDMTSLNGNEPSGHISVAVNSGAFNVMIGDPETGMEPINNIIFNHKNKIKLRIWFSDGINTYQKLNPDRNIANPQLIALKSRESDFSIYVDDVNGDDDNSGLLSSMPKKTILSAVNMLPDRINCNITIKIYPGIYREQINLYGITTKPGCNLYITGDETWTYSQGGSPNVRITGCDDDNTHTPIRQFGLNASKCSTVIIKGILFDYTSVVGAKANEGYYTLINCKSKNNLYGYNVTFNSMVGFSGCVAENNTNSGFEIVRYSYIDFTSCVAKNNNIGVMLDYNCSSVFYTSGEFSNNQSGIYLNNISNALFKTGYSGKIENNTSYGIVIVRNSFVEYSSRNSFLNNGTNTYLDKGGSSY